MIISIIGLLAALLLPGLNNAKRKAQSVVCRSNLKQLGLAFTLYTSDFGLPHFTTGFPAGDWIGYLAQYYGGADQVRICPATRDNPVKRGEGRKADRGAADLPVRIKAWKYSAVGGTPPSQQGTNWLFTSYGVNDWLQFSNVNAWLVPLFFRRDSAILSPRITPIFGDAQLFVGGPMEHHSPPRDLYSEYYPGIDSIAHFMMARHGGGFTAKGSLPVPAGSSLAPWTTHLVCFDGHVESAKLDNLWTYNWHRQWVTPATRPR